MENYYVESIIEKIAQEIKRLIREGIITEKKKIVLYGLDTFSFAMRTIFANYGYMIDSYISDNPEEVIRYKRDIKSFAARYMNAARDLIEICSVEERLAPYDEKVVVLNASKNCPQAFIEGLGYLENGSFFNTYRWELDDFKASMHGKAAMTLRDIHRVETDMLYRLDQFCRERELRYWVCGGTLLGTIRHKGFIPWDDDVDVFLPLEDYQRFIEEFQGNERYSLIVPGRSDRRNYFELFSKMVDNRTMVREDSRFVRKVHPAGIDIFPLIGLPEQEDQRRLFFWQYYELEKRIWEDFYAHNGDLGVYNAWHPTQKEFLRKYDFDQSDYVGVLATIYRERDCTLKTVYSETLRLPFEDIEVNVAGGYKEYLDNLYGKDWMELPEESKRFSHHNMEAYWLCEAPEQGD